MWQLKMTIAHNLPLSKILLNMRGLIEAGSQFKHHKCLNPDKMTFNPALYDGPSPKIQSYQRTLNDLEEIANMLEMVYEKQIYDGKMSVGELNMTDYIRICSRLYNLRTHLNNELENLLNFFSNLNNVYANYKKLSQSNVSSTKVDTALIQLCQSAEDHAKFADEITILIFHLKLILNFGFFLINTLKTRNFDNFIYISV